MSRDVPDHPALDRLLAEPAKALVVLDFDGTLAPIVSRPEDAAAHPDAAAALTAVADRGCQVAIVTGRPVAEVLRLGSGFANIPRLAIYGHYGLERWVDGQATSPARHPGVAAARDAVHQLVADGPGGVVVEDKDLSVAVHTRNADDPAASLEELRSAVDAIGTAHDLEMVPGRFVLELRPAGIDKGVAVRDLVASSGALTVVFAGDDLGDLPAVAALRDLDVTSLVVCSDSAETPEAMRDAADVIVDGPSGVVDFLECLAAAAPEDGP